MTKKSPALVVFDAVEKMIDNLEVTGNQAIDSIRFTLALILQVGKLSAHSFGRGANVTEPVSDMLELLGNYIVGLHAIAHDTRNPEQYMKFVENLYTEFVKTVEGTGAIAIIEANGPAEHTQN